MALVDFQAQRQPLPWIGGAYESPSLPISAQEAINVYPELGKDASNIISIRGVPGTSVFADLTDPIRGMRAAFGHLYVVAGNTAYRISNTGAIDTLGTVIDDGLPACLEQNIFEVLIVSGGKGYSVTGTVMMPITDPDFPDSSICGFLDGYGLLLEKESGRFHFTSINDFDTINGTDFATAEGAPDDLVSLLVDHRELWLFGEKSTEVWYNNGVAPFIRSPSGFMERGCGATYSPAKVDNTVYWLGDNGVVYRANDFTPLRISNHGIEAIIDSADMSTGIGFGYSEDGHEFYQLTFPGVATVVFDASTQAWHTRRTEGRSDCVYHTHAFAFEKNYVGGADGKIYQLDSNLYQHNGEPLVRKRAFGPLRTDGFTSMFSLTCVFETGANTDYANDSEVILEISDDSGATFPDRRIQTVGKAGQRRQEVTFWGLGGAYDNQRVYALTISDNAAFNLIDIYGTFS